MKAWWTLVVVVLVVQPLPLFGQDIEISPTADDDSDAAEHLPNDNEVVEEDSGDEDDTEAQEDAEADPVSSDSGTEVPTPATSPTPASPAIPATAPIPEPGPGEVSQPTEASAPTALRKASNLAEEQPSALTNVQPSQSVEGTVPRRFRFGSYGRVQPATDFDGRRGSQTRIVYPAPRVDEGSYAELEFGYLAYRGNDGVEVDTVATLALGDDFFHFDRSFDSTVAVRNLFAEARNLFVDGGYAWVGSRMYRGDDIYLLDFWPLDNLNTFGMGLGWRGESTRIGIHAGVNQLDDSYQYQVVDVVDERFVGAQEVVFLDRQRFIASLKAEQLFFGLNGDDLGAKFKMYGEFHGLPSGKVRLEQPRYEETLSDDYGFLVGAQVGTWGFMERSFVNLFVRYAWGLAAYGEDAIPFGVDDDKTASGAQQLLVGLSTNVETETFGVMGGAFVRYFTDADGFDEDFDDGWDAAWTVRGIAFIGDYFTPGIELSQQLRRPNGNNPTTGTQELASVMKLSLLPAVTFGEGTYARPQIRLNYTLSWLNEPAQSLFPLEDQRREEELVHFVGAAVEWWFNSSSYGL